VGCYLWGLHHEAVRRGYRFDSSKIDAPEDGCAGLRLPVTEGQMRLERSHLDYALCRFLMKTQLFSWCDDWP